MGIIEKSLFRINNKFKHGTIVMIELPEEMYLQSSLESVKYFISNGFGGVYISFNRPFRNIHSLLKQQDIDTSKIYFIDIAAIFEGISFGNDNRCIHISDEVNIDKLVRAIYTSLAKIRKKKKFIFIDSITTISLYKPLSETMRFSNFLVSMVKEHGNDETINVVLNVAKDLTQRKFIKDIALQTDNVIRV